MVTAVPLPDDMDVRVYSPDLTRTGFIGAVEHLTVTARHNQQPTAELALATDDPKAALLTAPGARVVVTFRGEHLLSGPVLLRSSDGTRDTRILTAQIADDWQLMSNVLLWPVPASDLAHQSSEYDVVSGPAETVVKTLLGAAIDRLGLPVTVASDSGRGSTITVNARMDRAADVLFPLVDQAGIGVTVRQSGPGLVLDCYEPAAWPITLSEAGGTITQGSWSLRPPTVTRVVLGADGEGTARVFRALANTLLEETWGFVAEAFVDARDLTHTDATFEAQATARMQAALAEGAMVAGLSLSLAETATFQYGPGGVHVGDTVSAELEGGQTVTDVLRTATLSWSADGGVSVTPTIGDHTDDPTVSLVRAVARAQRANRLLARR